MHMYICMYMYIYIYIHIFLYTCRYKYSHIYREIHIFKSKLNTSTPYDLFIVHMPQHTVTRCNTLDWVAPTLQCPITFLSYTHCSTLHHTATCCNTHE